jgi:hypothetical protein
MICPSCRAETSDGKKFCGKCGAALDAASPAAERIVPGALRCAACGSEVSPGKKFCGACGSSIGPPPEETRVEPAAVEPNSAAPVAPSAPEQLRETETSPLAVSEPVAAEHRDRRAPMLGIVAAVLIAGAVAVFLLLRTTGHAPPEPVASASKPAVDTAASPAAEPPGVDAPASPIPAPTPTRNERQPVPKQPPAYQPSVASNRSEPGTIINPIGPPTSPPAEPTPRPSDVSAPESTPAPTRQADSVEPPTQSLPPKNDPDRTPFPARPPIPPSLPPAALAYNGPRSGVLVWSGKLDKNDTLTIDGLTASAGSLQGELPGVPVNFEIDAANIGIRENPGAQNGWKRLVLISHAKHARITIRWSVK